MVRSGPSGRGGVAKVTSVQSVRIIERRYKVMMMRRDGHSIAEIADALNVAESTVRSDEVEVLNRMASEMSETAAENRQLQIQRLDALLKAYMPIARGYTEIVDDPASLSGKREKVYPPDPVMGAMVIKIEERRSKLLALDMPEDKGGALTGVREYVGVDMDQV